jgi:catechol 2,3-dioxygenase-like lactoylglutathione lyase family enzyme
VLLGIDHLVIAVRDLDEACDELERGLGLAATGGGRHPALGTQNRLAWLGDTYVELVSIADRAVAEGSWLGIPTIAVLEGGGGLATWAIATNSIDADIAALRSNGARLGDATAGERERPDGTIVRWRLATGESLGPAEPPFLIEHDPASAEWTAEDRAARAAQHHPIGGPVRLEVLELPFPDVPAAVHVLGRAADLRFRPSLIGGSARDANLGRQVVRLRAAHGAPGRPVISLESPAGDDRSVDLLGCRWSVRRSG